MTEMVSQPNPHITDLNLPLNGRYQVIEILTAKLWTRTYLAQDLHRPSQPDCVVYHLKTIPIVPNYRIAIRDLFAREASILEQLGTHPQIPSFLDWFEDEHGFYVAQEFVSGRPLSLDLVPEQGWQPEQVLQFLKSVLEPLAWTHRHGSVHGNLKPENLLRLDNGQIMAIDFSSMGMLQQTLMAAHGLFVPPRTAAQQGYQPLEQLQGLTCAASDVYAVGMIAVQALTGVKPVDFQVDSESVKILWQEHLPESSSRLQQQLIPILETMIQWDLPRRYANAHQVLLALEEVTPVSVPVSSGVAMSPAIAKAAHVERVIELPPVVEPTISRDTAEATDHSVVTIPVYLEAQPEPHNGPVPKKSAQAATGSTQKTRLLMQSFLKMTATNPSVRVGVGGVAVASTFAAVGWGLLNSVDWSEKTGQLWQRFTNASALNNNTPKTSVKALSEKWRQDWQQAALTYQQAETAFNQGEWAKVKALTTTLPDIPYWRDRGAALVQEVNVKTESSSSKHLEIAFEYAQERNFTHALAELEKIDAEPALSGVVQAKTREYREKQNIRAWFDLQRAYDRAIARDFSKALAFLYQIPPGTDAYATAQAKIAEYKQKQTIQVKTKSSVVSDRSQQSAQVISVTAQSTVDASVPNHAVDVDVDISVERANQQAAIWLKLAEQQAKAGQLATALTTLEKIPVGTLAYAEARDKRLELAAQLQPTSTPKTVVVHAQQQETTNPAHLASIDQPLIVGRAELQWVR